MSVRAKQTHVQSKVAAKIASMQSSRELKQTRKTLLFLAALLPQMSAVMQDHSKYLHGKSTCPSKLTEGIPQSWTCTLFPYCFGSCSQNPDALSLTATGNTKWIKAATAGCLRKLENSTEASSSSPLAPAPHVHRLALHARWLCPAILTVATVPQQQRCLFFFCWRQILCSSFFFLLVLRPASRAHQEASRT